MPPQLGDRRDIELELILALDQRQALGQRLHHSVLDAVVDHLDEVTGAIRATVQPAAIRCRRENLRKRLDRARLPRASPPNISA